MTFSELLDGCASCGCFVLGCLGCSSCVAVLVAGAILTWKAVLA